MTGRSVGIATGRSDVSSKSMRMQANLDALTAVERSLLEGEMEAEEMESRSSSPLAQLMASRAASRGATHRSAADPMQPGVEAAALNPAAFAAAAASASVGAGAQMNLPLSDKAKGALEAFDAMSIGGLVLAIDGEEVALRTTAPPNISTSGLKLMLPDEPCYVLYRWDGGGGVVGAEHILFLFLRPESAPLRQKILHASSMWPLIQKLQAGGVAITKSIEGIERDDLSDKELASEMEALHLSER